MRYIIKFIITNKGILLLPNNVLFGDKQYFFLMLLGSGTAYIPILPLPKEIAIIPNFGIKLSCC